MKLKALFVLPTVLPLFGLAVPAQAAATSANPYYGKSPYAVINGRSCNSDARVVGTAEIVRGDGVYGTVQFKRNMRCNTAWAYVNFGAKLGAGEFGNAYVRRAGPNGTHKLAYNCDTANGNKHVQAGQTSCYTPMMVRQYSMWVEGYLYHKNSVGAWVLHAFGTTKYW